MTHSAAVITCSDRAAADVYEDRSGPILVAALQELGFETTGVIVPDDAAQIRAAVGSAFNNRARVILTTGGTGVSPRDVTVEVTKELVSFEVPGIAEAVRAAGADHTPMALLSCGIAGVIESETDRSFIFNAPGSRGGARDAMTVLAPLLNHIVEQLDGADHDLTLPPSQG